MSQKTAEKTQHLPRAAAPSPDELQAAYQCHTLAQILYGHIARTRPWLLQHMARSPAAPVAGPCAAPWMQTSPACC